MAVGILGLGLITRFEVGDRTDIFSREPDAFNLFLIAMQALPLAFRRRWPVAVLSIVTVSFAIDRVLDYPNTLASAGIVLAIHAVGSELPKEKSLRIGGAFAVAITLFTVSGVLTLDSVSWGDVVATFLISTVPLMLGREVHERRRRLDELRTRAELAEERQQRLADEAVAEERARIARELHDVVAHQMTVMTLQAEGAGRIANDQDPRIIEALQTIRDSGHSALSDMRRMVGVLRTSEETGELAPLPGLADLNSLVDQMKAAGLDVELTEVGTKRPLDSGLELSAFRIVQESLTNVARHAGPTAKTAVTVHYDDQSLNLRITDDGRGANAPEAREGHGIAGMRERVAVLNGTLKAGPNPGGGFRVIATLPYSS